MIHYKFHNFLSPKYSWLYLANMTNIYRIPLNSSGNSEPVKIVETYCTSSFALDYKARNIYMFDGCIYQLQASKIDGSDIRLINLNEDATTFPYGTSLYKDELFWIESKREGALVNCFNTTNSAMHSVYRSPYSHVFYDIQVVHASNQPSG